MRHTTGNPFFIVIPAALSLFFSGAAGLVNEVVWQRALKRLLGGSETISSMIVVLVFMLGLGLGSVLMGRRAGRVKNPLLALAIVEGLLALAGTLVCLVLRSDLQQSIVRAQFIAAGFDVPLAVVFGFGAALLLLVPCLLMGATIPLASEGCQRNLGFRNPRVLGALFFVNTLGAVLGAMIASFYLIPRLGFTLTMVLSVGLNAGAGLMLALLLRLADPAVLIQVGGVTAAAPPAPSAPDSSRFARAMVLMFGLGFCSLGYEMILFRLFALGLEPLPYTFAMVLSGFLLSWSLGAEHASSRPETSIEKPLSRLAYAMIFPLVAFYGWFILLTATALPGWTKAVAAGFWLLGLMLSFLPCFLFGYLFAWVMAAIAKSWGRDVGRAYAWNTAGSCLGILLVTFFGYELHIVVLLIALIVTVIALRAHWLSGDAGGSERRHQSVLRYAIAGLAVILVAGFSVDFSPLLTGNRLRMFFGRDGVVGVDAGGSLIWDGLWHSKFSNGSDHIGTNNWRMAAIPVLVHPTGRIREACVIGLGTGITAATLAKLDSLRVLDVYEINRGLAKILGEYSAGSLGVLENPKINVIWRDARAGLALRDKKYDLLVTQPLYLKQSGSALLNSREFLELLRSRLEPDGIACLYSRGTTAQKRAVQETAAEVFAYGESFHDGYLLVLSQERIRVERDILQERFREFGRDPLWREIAGYDLTRDAEAVFAQLDRPRHSWSAAGFIVTDDHPVIEYPDALEAMLAERDGPGRRSGAASSP